MAYVETGGLRWPLFEFANGTVAVMDAAGEKFAMIGRLAINGHPGTTKTLNTTGSSKIEWYGGATAVFDDAASSLDVGIQGVNTSGPPAQPDGTFSVKAVVTTAANASPTLTTINSWHAITPTTGTVTLTEGDLIAVVWDLTARGGSDAINVTPSWANSMLPTTNAYVAAAWGATGASQSANVLITFSDGTLGWLDGGTNLGTAVNLTWTDATNPDELGMIFQVPFDCKVDAIVVPIRTADANGDFIVYLSSGVSSGASTRVTLATVTVDAAQLGPISVDRPVIIRLATEITLTANTDYCVSVKASGAGNVRFSRSTLGTAVARAMFSGGTTLFSVQANAGGEFGSSSTTVMYPISVRISQISTSSSTAYVIGG